MRRIPGFLALTAFTVSTTGLLTVPVASAGGGCHRAVSMESGVTQVIADHACWVPVVAQVDVGATLTFVNEGGVEHNLGGIGPIGFDEFTVGAVRKISFSEAGIFPYACTLHPGMAGAVVVGNPLAGPVPQAAAMPSDAPAAAVDLSSSDDSNSSLVDSTAVRVGSGAVVVSALGAGLIGVRRRRGGAAGV